MTATNISTPIKPTRPFYGLSARAKTDLSLPEKTNLLDGTQWANEFSFGQIKMLAAFVDIYHVPKESVSFFEGDKSAFLGLIVTG